MAVKVHVSQGDDITHEQGVSIDVDGSGHLHVMARSPHRGAEGDRLALYPPGHWQRATLEISDPSH